MHLGGIESWFAGEHYEIFIPSAGGEFEVEGDYLFRDYMGLGNNGGLWGILRVDSGAEY
jgi:short subunit fatty acids transporter